MSAACAACAVSRLATAGRSGSGALPDDTDATNGPACDEATASDERRAEVPGAVDDSPVAGARRSMTPPPGRGRRSGSVFAGLSDGDVARLVAAVSSSPGRGAESSELSAERFARAALTTAIEPGDLEAGRLVGALGAVGLLRAIVEGHNAEHVLRFTRDADAVPLPPGEDLALSLEGAGEQFGHRFDTDGSGGAADSLLSAFESLSPERPQVDARAVRRIAECLARWRVRLSLEESCRALERAARLGAVLLTPDTEVWPEGFAALEHGEPLALWIRGDPERLARLDRSVALVGARASTDYGEHVAMEAAAGLVGRGFAVVSGGAYGIDAAAHRATLASGGLTVAFLAGGVDRLYPAGNSDLLRRVSREGVLAAELPPGNAPTRWRFLMRNRLIAAAASATVVVEAGRRSGSLNTAGHAAQLGGPLGAVPGSILSPASAGCHRLIREYAAICVTSADEMAELADPLGTGPTGEPGAAAVDTVEVPPAGGDAQGAVLSALASARGASADEIAARSSLPFTTVAAILGRLDLAGRARESGGGWSLSERRHA